ncbi:MAG: Signal recognition particle receptor protein FtsY [Labilithrix sp.]|nr:Signal recognition particle receptor protein FtsY [Labilithrix sp.]
MKFLCDNCKAKYQIADEKVAGKTVRMKCRKCGHQIEVRAAVTETSVSTSPPAAPGADAPRPAAKSGLATSLSAAKPRAPVGQPQAPAASALAGAFQRTVQDAPQSVPFPGQASPLELSVTDEWYVAINGVPVGPVRISELRRKAGSGAVTEDSLCWQEGLEEWRPVRSIPELAAIVREAAQGNRPSLVSPPPAEGRGSRPPTPQRPAPSPPARTPDPPRAPTFDAPPPRPLAPSRSNVVPLRVAASSASDAEPPVTSPLTGGNGGAAAAFAPSFAPQAAPTFAPQVQQAPAPAPAPPPAPVAISDPFAVPPAPAAATASLAPPAPYAAFGPSPSQAAIAPPPQKRGVPLWFWPILLFTGVFGVSAAVFVFRQQQQPAPVVIQMSPTATATTPAEPKVETPPPPTNEIPVASTAPTSAKVATGGPRAAAPAAAAPEKKGIDLGGLVPGAGGPNVGGGAGAGAGGGGGLDSSSVERVVASHRAGVKRTCWERGGADQKSSVNVTVSATVAPDGSVSNTSSSGDDPVVAKCIEAQVKSWRFNAPGSTTTVNIPFKFVRQ